MKPERLPSVSKSSGFPKEHSSLLAEIGQFDLTIDSRNAERLIDILELPNARGRFKALG
jgi:hypothetical protein